MLALISEVLVACAVDGLDKDNVGFRSYAVKRKTALGPLLNGNCGACRLTSACN